MILQIFPPQVFSIYMRHNFSTLPPYLHQKANPSSPGFLVEAQPAWQSLWPPIFASATNAQSPPLAAALEGASAASFSFRIQKAIFSWSAPLNNDKKKGHCSKRTLLNKSLKQKRWRDGSRLGKQNNVFEKVFTGTIILHITGRMSHWPSYLRNLLWFSTSSILPIIPAHKKAQPRSPTGFTTPFLRLGNGTSLDFKLFWHCFGLEERPMVVILSKKHNPIGGNSKNI